MKRAPSSAEDHDHALRLIYDAALDAGQWHEALSAVSRLTGAQTFHLCGWNAAESRDELGIVTDATWHRPLEQYNRHYAAADPRVVVCAGLGPGALMVCSEHFDERSVSRSEIYQDHLIPNGLRYSMASILGSGPDMTMVLGLMRPADAGAWRREEVAAARRVLPHLQRAAALTLLQRDHTAQRAAAAAAGDLTHLGLVTLSAAGRVLNANARAQSLLRAQTLLRLRGGRLQACDANVNAALQRALVAVAARGAPVNLALASADGANAAWLTVMRARSPAAAQDARGSLVCVIAEARRQRVASVRALIDWFGLTPAEARLVRALALAGDLERCAAEAGITRNTAKTQLARAMAKLDVDDQRELIRRVLQLPAVRG